MGLRRSASREVNGRLMQISVVTHGPDSYLRTRSYRCDILFECRAVVESYRMAAEVRDTRNSLKDHSGLARLVAMPAW